MRFMIGVAALGALAACSGGKAANNGAAANVAAPSNGSIPLNTQADAKGAPASNASANLAAGGSPITPRPVMVGIDAELDKCSSTGRSTGIRPITVRSAPHPAAGEVERLARVTDIAICDQDDRSDPQAGWYGIVYPATGDDIRACGLGGASAGNGGVAYSGPCKSGWVRSTDIEVIAG